MRARGLMKWMKEGMNKRPNSGKKAAHDAGEGVLEASENVETSQRRAFFVRGLIF